MRNYLVLALLLLGLWGCGEGNVVLDNPRPKAVKFQFDSGESFEVGSHGHETIHLDPGRHTVEVMAKDGELMADTTFELKDQAIVHSGASTYLVWRQLYGLQTDRATLLNERWVEFDSLRAFGDFRVYPPHHIFIDGGWDVGLDEELPSSETMYISTDFEIKSKVFRAPEFVATYRELAKQSR